MKENKTNKKENMLIISKLEGTNNYSSPWVGTLFPI